MTPPHALFHTLLRPSILQILRAVGYAGAKVAVVDSLTDLAARYMAELCHTTALYAAHKGTDDPSPDIVDVRMALQHVGALQPERDLMEQDFEGVEDLRGVDEFVAWVQGKLNKEIGRIAREGADDDEATDYLHALKKRHGKSDDDSKYAGTLLGRSNEHGDLQVEGGEFPSIQTWNKEMQTAKRKSPEPMGDMDGTHAEDDEDGAASSGLSSLGDRDLGDYEDMAF